MRPQPPGSISPWVRRWLHRWSDLQARAESSEFGRGVISAFVVATLTVVVATNLPASPLRSALMGPGQPYLGALGLDQSWSVYAPEPRRQAIDLRGLVRYDDGSTGAWRIPTGDPILSGFRDYRWRKWMENLVSDANSQLWRPAAIWISTQTARRGRRVVQVMLERRLATLQPPGQSPDRLPWQQKVFYTLNLTASGR